MTTNQTIDGVPREAFKWALEQLAEDGNSGCGYFDSLRALMDAPAKAAEPYTHMRIDVDGNPYRCNPNDHGDAFPVYLGPAAQPQGEPVAYRVVFNNGEKSRWWDGAPLPQDLCDVRDGVIRSIERAYAEQPAPVAVVERCLHCNQPGGQCCTTASTNEVSHDNP